MTESQARELAAAVLAGIAPEADFAAVRPDEDLRAALDLDSMDFMNLVVALSERTGLAIPQADVPRLDTPRGMVTYLAAR